MTSTRVAVVIPFYQSQTGILRRAVESVLAQRDVPLPRIVIVDDASPVNPRSELDDLLRRNPEHLEILTRSNGGPGAARNTALRHIQGTAEIVAFLDSDDIWEPDHLKIALAALDRGFDFFFCDAVHRESDATVFQTQTFPDSDCRVLLPQASLYEYRGDFFQLILDRCPMQTSTIAYRASSFPAISFQEEFRTAGEDYLFFLEIAYQKKRTAFSTLRNVRLGIGLNIYSGVEWGTVARIMQLYFQQLYVARVRKQFKLTLPQERICRRLTAEHRQRVTENVWAMFANGRKGASAVVWSYARLDPLIVPKFPIYAVRRMASWFSRVVSHNSPLGSSGKD